MSSVIHSLVPCLKSLVPYNGDMKYLYKFIRFTHLWVTGKSEIRISKLETNTNEQNPKFKICDQLLKWRIRMRQRFSKKYRCS